LIQEIDGPNGKPLVKFQDQPRRVMTDQVAREATQVMRQVIESGTGTAAAIPGHPAAGKTGTAERFQDAWFVGFVPQLATAIWMGDPKGEVPMVGVQGINVVGGSFPARAWSAFMQQALSLSTPVDFAPPDPAQIPAGVTLVAGQARGAGGPAGGSIGGGDGGGGSTGVTTWCWSSCGH
jgi:penicillin-binding protein 1A